MAEAISFPGFYFLKIECSISPRLVAGSGLAILAGNQVKVCEICFIVLLSRFVSHSTTRKTLQ